MIKVLISDIIDDIKKNNIEQILTYIENKDELGVMLGGTKNILIKHAAEEGNIEMLKVLEEINGKNKKNDEGYQGVLKCKEIDKKIKVLEWLKNNKYPITESFLSDTVKTQEDCIVEWMKKQEFFQRPIKKRDELNDILDKMCVPWGTNIYYGAAQHSLKRFCWLKEFCNGFPGEKRLLGELHTIAYYAIISNNLDILKYLNDTGLLNKLEIRYTMQGLVDMKIFRWLIENGHRINIADIAEGAKWYDIQDIEFLIEKGYCLPKRYEIDSGLLDINKKDTNILLIGAARMGNLPLIKWLILEHNLQITKKVLCASLKSNSIPIISFLLSQKCQYDVLSFSAFAIQSENIDVLDFLWNSGLFYTGDPLSQVICDNEYQYSTLMEYGVQTHNTSIIDWLLKHNFQLTGPSFAYSIPNFSLIDYLYRLHSPMDGWSYRHSINYFNQCEINSYLNYLQCSHDYYDPDQDSDPYYFDNEISTA